jgi:hypothetical protein
MDQPGRGVDHNDRFVLFGLPRAGKELNRTLGQGNLAGNDDTAARQVEPDVSFRGQPLQFGV